MKKALISPDEKNLVYISEFTKDVPPKPILSKLQNACRVAQVESVPFDVAPPLYWIECEDYVNDYEYYFNTLTNTIDPIPNVSYPG
jgi:hypothetical protein